MEALMKSIDFKKEIWDVLRSLRDSMDSMFRPIIEEHGLTMMQAHILLVVKHYERPTVGCLCGEIGLTSGNASSMCKKLEKAGFLMRNRDPNDERFVALTLTQRGEATMHTIGEAFEKKYGQIIESRSEEELTELIAGMKRFNAFIQEMSMLK
jgi:DNA-binding MarR family transcriptional regulator